MKTIKLEVELTYDNEVIHDDDPESLEWFYNNILKQSESDELLLLHSNEFGDTIGEIKVINIDI